MAEAETQINKKQQDFRSSINLHGFKIFKNTDIEILKSAKVRKFLDFNDSEIFIDYNEDYLDEIHDFNEDDSILDYWDIDELGFISPKAPLKFSAENLFGLHSVAKTGNYIDLLNKPVYHKIATTGEYEDLNNPMFIADDINTITDEQHPIWLNLSGYTEFFGTDSLNFNCVPNGDLQTSTSNNEYSGRKATLWINNGGKFVFFGNDNNEGNHILLDHVDYTNINGLRLCRTITDNEVFLTDGTVLENIYVGNDGEKYSGTKIGDLIWLRENLRETKTNTGQDFVFGQNVENDGENQIVIYVPSFFYNENGVYNPIQRDFYVKAYGYFYSYHVINSDKLINIVDNGVYWHIPMLNEFQALKDTAENHQDGIMSIKSRRKQNSPYLSRFEVVKPSNQKQIHFSKIAGWDFNFYKHINSNKINSVISWDGTQFIIDLSAKNLYNLKISDTISAINFGIKTGFDSLINSNESIVIVDNSVNIVAITSIIFDTMSNLYTYEWYGKTIPTNIAAGLTVKFIFRNIGNNKISVETNI